VGVEGTWGLGAGAIYYFFKKKRSKENPHLYTYRVNIMILYDNICVKVFQNTRTID
jgi:hypothetical protein